MTRDNAALVLTIVFGLALVAGGFTMSVTAGLFSTAAAALVLAVLYGWR